MVSEAVREKPAIAGFIYLAAGAGLTATCFASGSTQATRAGWDLTQIVAAAFVGVSGSKRFPFVGSIKGNDPLFTNQEPSLSKIFWIAIIKSRAEALLLV